MAFRYEVIEQIAVLSEIGDTSKELNLIAYGNRPPKYDLRSWKHTDGEDIMLKGVTLTEEEAITLREALNGREELKT